MCGIAGLFDPTLPAAAMQATLQRMIATLHHRGPDGSGTFAADGVGLAHSRLSIIDLAGGAQPIHNEDRSVQVVFNGEIFNHVELRQQLLQRGHRFGTASDTEVIVHLYEEQGDAFVHALNGQFAIALWDVARRRLVLARDRTGIRPLFYAQAGARLAFASELKALFTLPQVRRRIDVHVLAEIFSYWAALEPHTVFEGVLSLPPGHLLVADDRGVRSDRYWDWEFPSGADTSRSEDDCAEELRTLLIDAVRLQLRADVPVGAYISGGLDSSIITALIRNHTDTPLRTFSLTFDDPEFDESGQQQQLVQHLGTEHSALRVTGSAIARAFPKTIWHIESPTVRTAPTPLMLLSAHVHAAGYKVVLTGEGADEVFGGYDLFKEAKIRRFMARAPQSAWRPRILERLYPYLKTSPVAGQALAQRFFSEGAEHLDEPWFAHLPRIRATRRTLQFLRPEWQQQLQATDPVRALGATLPAGIAAWAPMARDQYIEAHTLMSGYLLSSQGDRVAMAHSVEGRMPFLDHRLIEFANRLPAHYKLRGLCEKALLKRSMRGELPEAMRIRAKQPFRAPDSSSFFEAGKPVDYVAAVMERKRVDEAGLFDPDATGRLFEKCRKGRAIGFADNMAFVGILSSMLLHQQFVQPATWSGMPADYG